MAYYSPLTQFVHEREAQYRSEVVQVRIARDAALLRESALFAGTTAPARQAWRQPLSLQLGLRRLLHRAQA